MKLRIFAILLLLAFAAGAQRDLGTIQTLADITGSGAAVKICSTCSDAKWVQIVALSTNTAAVRWGDSNTSASRGSAIGAGGGQFLPPGGGPYVLAALYVFVANGDKVTVTWSY